MAEKMTCNQCGQPTVNGGCANKQCGLATGDSVAPLETILPEDLSVDMTQVIDYTGTLGVAPASIDSDFVIGSPVADNDDSAQTRMIDDNFYKQIQECFPSESSSKSAQEDIAVTGSVGSQPLAFVSQTVSLRLDGPNYSVEEFVTPVRDIQFPSDTASLEQIRELKEADIEGDEYHIVEKLGEGGYGVVFLSLIHI